MIAAKTKVYTAETGEDGAEAELALAVLAPSGKTKQDAKIYSLAEYGKAVERGVKIKPEVDKFLRKMSLWDDDRQRDYDGLRKSLLRGELKLKTGGIRKKEARKIALKMARDRAAMADMLSVRSEIEQNTAEYIAAQAEFNYLVAACTVYNEGPREGKPYFTHDGEHGSVDVYIEKSADRAAFDVAVKFSEALYGKRQDVYAEFPENRFLKDYGFVDAEGNLIDHEGKRVDEQGRRVDDEGYYLDASGQRVDSEGNPVDEKGDYKVEFTEFLEDDEDAAGDAEAVAPVPDTDAAG